MELKNRLEKNNIQIEDVPKGGSTLRTRWEDRFAGNLKKAEKQKIFLTGTTRSNGFLWHLFSYGMKDCLEGIDADEAFDNERKYSCYVFWQDTDEAYLIKDASNLSSLDLQTEYDIYVTDTGFHWTYVRTHETGSLGPYFSRVP